MPDRTTKTELTPDQAGKRMAELRASAPTPAPAQAQPSTPEGYVRISVADLDKLKALAQEAILIKRRLADAELELRSATLVIQSYQAQAPSTANQPADQRPSTVLGPHPQLTETIPDTHTHVRLKPGNAIRELQDIAARTDLPNPSLDPHNLPPAYISKEGKVVTQPKEYFTGTPYSAAWAMVVALMELHPEDYPPTRLHDYLFDSRQVDLTLNALERGVTRGAAFRLGGIPQRLSETWRTKAKQAIEPYQTLFDFVELAESRSETKLVTRWEFHTRDSWQAAAALLSKRFPDQWGDKKVLELSMAQLADLSPTQLAEIVGEDAVEWLEASPSSTPDTFSVSTAFSSGDATSGGPVLPAQAPEKLILNPTAPSYPSVNQQQPSHPNMPPPGELPPDFPTDGG